MAGHRAHGSWRVCSESRVASATQGPLISFRARLTIFFVLIVVVPMVAIGVLMFRLINDSEQGKADARVSALAAAAGSLYESEVASARTDAETLGRAIGSLHGKRSRSGSRHSRRRQVWLGPR
jgi:nitrogen fixation/metabolism regulation signal transduction histidine kinase